MCCNFSIFSSIVFLIFRDMPPYAVCSFTSDEGGKSSALRHRTLLISYHGINIVGIKLQVTSEEKWKREASNEEPFF